MEKTFFLAFILTVIISCKNDTKSDQNDSVIGTEGNEKTAKQNEDLTLLKGDFIYYADAAVLQTHTEVYGVVIDEKMHELDKQVQQYKNADTDMVPVEIRGKIIPKPDNEVGWPFRVEIKEILNISKPNPEDNTVVKLGS
ncbi:hypothetical protein APS56_11820 [Pseudalgibacter alginicilyticus]|uniref:NlpE C-terminal OB domain-containing protein n=1 Tax=Pseudalgibacter alginicilyticus TaxID=1736674 RepID=A0A0P0D475_9FLAO|nr:hypothetical protein [Pseudalgibacter alginicilyticus]ALJ05770.1 hypothetical protein APS56_11820 [Pseudalgibacter alginicilyticus]